MGSAKETTNPNGPPEPVRQEDAMNEATSITAADPWIGPRPLTEQRRDTIAREIREAFDRAILIHGAEPADALQILREFAADESQLQIDLTT